MTRTGVQGVVERVPDACDQTNGCRFGTHRKRAGAAQRANQAQVGAVQLCNVGVPGRVVQVCGAAKEGA